MTKNMYLPQLWDFTEQFFMKIFSGHIVNKYQHVDICFIFQLEPLDGVKNNQKLNIFKKIETSYKILNFEIENKIFKSYNTKKFEFPI